MRQFKVVDDASNCRAHTSDSDKPMLRVDVVYKMHRRKEARGVLEEEGVKLPEETTAEPVDCAVRGQSASSPDQN